MKKVILLLIPFFGLMGCANNFDSEISLDSGFKSVVDLENPNTIYVTKDSTINVIVSSWDNHNIIVLENATLTVQSVWTMSGGSITIKDNAGIYVNAGGTVAIQGTDFVLETANSSVCANKDANSVFINDDDITPSDDATGDVCFNEADLPVEMISFNTKLEGQSAQLTWATATELNSASFIVERSIDQRNWEAIGEVEAAGNSNTRIDYSFTDVQVPSATIAYYRLKQVDLDGVYAFYGPNAVRLTNTDVAVTVYPNPVQFGESVNILSNFDEMEVRMYDASGRTYFQEKSDLNHVKVPMIYGTGMLFVEVKNGKNVITQKLIVN